MVDRRLFPENQPSEYEPRNEVIYAMFSNQFLEYQGAKFVREYEQSQVLAMLEGEFKDSLQFFAVKFFKKHRDDQTMYEPDFASVLQPIPKPFKNSK